MAKTVVVIGCRLPHGLIITHPINRNITQKIAGLNESRIIGATHITTEVDAELWELWKAIHEDYAPLKNGAIFETKSANDAERQAREFEKVKTGFEAMPQDALGVKPSKD
jgi:hypothetical protein